MCGICGILEFNNTVNDTILHKMNDCLSHRGPDAKGTFIDGKIGLGHRRLSIIDINGGAQPMQSNDGSLQIAYNGEIYNFLEIKETLQKKGLKFNTNSDTEVLLNSYKYWGIDCLKHISGMFAFAIWDNNIKQLFLARDHLGIKPLVYYYDSERFVFASEFNALIQHNKIPRVLNLPALSDFISFQCVPAPDSMFKNVKKLEPAHYIIVKDNNLKIKSYWRPEYTNKIILSEEDAIKETYSRFKQIVKQHLISEVPLGLFLSGGIDSTLVTAAVSEVSSAKIKTFSIGFDYEKASEIKYSREAAKVFDTDHTELILKPDILNILPVLVEHYGEPFADSSAIPTYYISQQTRKFVTVALAGDGGDELFGGYEVFGQMNFAKRVNPFIRPLHPFFNFVKNIYGRKDSKRNASKLLRFLNVISSEKNNIYTTLRCAYYNEIKEKLFNTKFKNQINLADSQNLYQKLFNETEAVDFIEKILDIDARFTLPHALLTKVDIASMAHSLEIRVPFLDKRFAEFAFSLPADFKLRNNTGKYILKKILEKYFSSDFIYRKKMGFSIPLAQWMRNEMKYYIKDIIFTDGKTNALFFNDNYIKKLYNYHMDSTEDNSATLWMLINFKLWMKIFKVNHNV